MHMPKRDDGKGGRGDQKEVSTANTSEQILILPPVNGRPISRRHFSRIIAKGLLVGGTGYFVFESGIKPSFAGNNCGPGANSCTSSGQVNNCYGTPNVCTDGGSNCCTKTATFNCCTNKNTCSGANANCCQGGSYGSPSFNECTGTGAGNSCATASGGGVGNDCLESSKNKCDFGGSNTCQGYQHGNTCQGTATFNGCDGTDSNNTCADGAQAAPSNCCEVSVNNTCSGSNTCYGSGTWNMGEC